MIQITEDMKYRTQVLIDCFKGNEDEVMMLKGVLCMDHDQRPEDVLVIRSCFDHMMIACRIDDVVNADRERLRKEINETWAKIKLNKEEGHG